MSKDLSVCTILAEAPPCQGTESFRLREKGSLLPKGEAKKKMVKSFFQWGDTEIKNKALPSGWSVEVDKAQKMSIIASSTRP